MPPGGRRWTWRWGKGRCCWPGRREGCRRSCNTGSTGSEGSRGRKGSPGKRNTEAVSEEDSLGVGLRSARHRLMKSGGLLGGSTVSVPVSP